MKKIEDFFAYGTYFLKFERGDSKSNGQFDTKKSLIRKLFVSEKWKLLFD